MSTAAVFVPTRPGVGRLVGWVAGGTPPIRRLLVGCLRQLTLRVVFALGAVFPAHAQPDTLYLRTLAANCAQCHGTAGHAAADAALPPLAGRPRDDLLAQLKAFKSGTRPSTIMQQLARGYTDAQLEQLAGYFAAQK